MSRIDPITIATIWHYIQRVCREMRYTAERTATNVLVVTLHDMAYGIWNAEMARKAYKVAINPETFKIDNAETAKLRKSS